MVPVKGWTGIMITLLALNLFMIYGCSEKSVQEKMSEQALKQVAGKDVDVKIQGGNVQIADKDSRTEMTETTTWPTDLVSDVPKFTAGKIKRVIKTQEQTGSWTFNIYLEGISGDDVKNYENAMREMGWQADLMQMGDKGGYLNGQKGTMGMNFGFSLERKDGVLAVFNRP
jgi:hypothetical protein